MRIRNTKLLQIKQLQNIQNNQEFNTTIITSNYTINNNDDIVICDNQFSIVLQLPAIDSEIEKKLFIIRRINTGTVTIRTQQNNIFNINFGARNIVLSDLDCGVILKAKGNVWYVIQKIDCETITSIYGNGIYGYVCGGRDAAANYFSIIDRFHFPFDGGNTIYVGNLNKNNAYLTANNSSIHGYVCGGCDAMANYFSTIDRFQFPFDSGNAVHVGNLNGSRLGPAANNSSIHGYVCDGYISLEFSIVERFQFPFNNGNAVHVGNLNENKGRLSANNSSIYGYVCGGNYYNNGVYYYVSTVNYFQFPFDSGNTARGGNINESKAYSAANNSSTYGYICGGFSGSNLMSINRIQFPFITGNAIQAGNLSGTRAYLSANNSSIHGYVCGGGMSGLSTIDCFQFPFDSGNAIYVGNLSANRNYLAANDETFIPNVMY